MSLNDCATLPEPECLWYLNKWGHLSLFGFTPCFSTFTRFVPNVKGWLCHPKGSTALTVDELKHQDSPECWSGVYELWIKCKKNNGQICIHLGHWAAALFKGTHNHSYTQTVIRSNVQQFTHTFTHGRVNQARRPPAHRGQIVLGVVLTSTREPGNKLATSRLQVNLFYLLT